MPVGAKACWSVFSKGSGRPKVGSRGDIGVGCVTGCGRLAVALAALLCSRRLMAAKAIDLPEHGGDGIGAGVSVERTVEASPL